MNRLFIHHSCNDRISIVTRIILVFLRKCTLAVFWKNIFTFETIENLKLDYPNITMYISFSFFFFLKNAIVFLALDRNDGIIVRNFYINLRREEEKLSKFSESPESFKLQTDSTGCFLISSSSLPWEPLLILQAVLICLAQL